MIGHVLSLGPGGRCWPTGAPESGGGEEHFTQTQPKRHTTPPPGGGGGGSEPAGPLAVPVGLIRGPAACRVVLSDLEGSCLLTFREGGPSLAADHDAAQCKGLLAVARSGSLSERGRPAQPARASGSSTGALSRSPPGPSARQKKTEAVPTQLPSGAFTLRGESAPLPRARPLNLNPRRATGTPALTEAGMACIAPQKHPAPARVAWCVTLMWRDRDRSFSY